MGFVDNYCAAFNCLFGLVKEYSDYDMKERLLKNLWTPELSKNTLGAINTSMDFLGACNIIQNHCIRVMAYKSCFQ